VASKPIPTMYSGVRFRSRLEARWAKFWDGLNIKWEYETQGFLTDGQPYLPDFVIWPAGGTVWAEIKSGWKADPGGVAKWQRFAVQRPQPSRAILIAGAPSIHNSPLVIGGDWNATEPVRGPWEDDAQEWRPCPSGHHFGLAYPGTFGAKFAEDGCEDHFGGDGEQRIADACTAALSARFGTHESPSSGTAA